MQTQSLLVQANAAQFELRLTPELIGRLPARSDERGPILVRSPHPDFYRDTARALLAELGTGQPLWVFAAGSLIWKPRMPVVERRSAEIQGWHRAFCMRDRRARGSPSRPGLMMSLDRGGDCRGFVQRMDPNQDAETALTSLLEKEPPLPPVWVEAQTNQGQVPALLFAAHPSYPLYSPEPDIETLADMTASSVGYIGTMAEYLLNTVNELHSVGAFDPHLWQLQALVADRLQALPERQS